MEPSESEPTEMLGEKITGFASGLSDEEVAILYRVLDQAARRASDVEGFAYRLPVGIQGDPCDGGEIADPKTFAMVGAVMQNLVDTRGTALRLRRR